MIIYITIYTHISLIVVSIVKKFDTCHFISKSIKSNENYYKLIVSFIHKPIHPLYNPGYAADLVQVRDRSIRFRWTDELWGKEGAHENCR